MLRSLVLVAAMTMAHSASAIMLNCPSPQEHETWMQVMASPFCPSYLKAYAEGWKNSYCISNQSGTEMKNGDVLQACVVFDDATDTVNIYGAVDGHLR